MARRCAGPSPLTTFPSAWRPRTSCGTCATAWTPPGFWVSEVVDHGFIHSLYSFDPNNIAVEFSVPVAGVDIRKNPVMADTEPTPCAREGAEPVPGVWPKVAHPTARSERRVYPGEGLLLVGKEPEDGDKGPRHV